MALNVPTSTQWITFPTSPRDQYALSWRDGYPRHAIYYSCQCLWGELPAGSLLDKHTTLSSDEHTKLSSNEHTKQEIHPVKAEKASTTTLQEPKTGLNDKLEIKGSTKLFIAAEFVESQYVGGPYRKFHIKELARADDPSQPVKLWLTMQLNNCFHYAQRGSERFIERLIIYHPSIVPSISPPRIFQSRFFDLTAADIGKALIEDTDAIVSRIPGFTLPAKAGSKGLAFGWEMARESIGHFLHSFLEEENVEQAARWLAEYNEQKAKAVADEKVGDHVAAKERIENLRTLSQPEKRLLALQCIETDMAAKQNAKTDEETRVQAEDEAAFAAQLEQIYGKTEPKSWWMKFYDSAPVQRFHMLREIARVQQQDCYAVVQKRISQFFDISALIEDEPVVYV